MALSAVRYQSVAQGMQRQLAAFKHVLQGHASPLPMNPTALTVVSKRAVDIAHAAGLSNFGSDHQERTALKELARLGSELQFSSKLVPQEGAALPHFQHMVRAQMDILDQNGIRIAYTEQGDMGSPLVAERRVAALLNARGIVLEGHAINEPSFLQGIAYSLGAAPSIDDMNLLAKVLFATNLSLGDKDYQHDGYELIKTKRDVDLGLLYLLSATLADEKAPVSQELWPFWDKLRRELAERLSPTHHAIDREHMQDKMESGQKLSSLERTTLAWEKIRDWQAQINGTIPGAASIEILRAPCLPDTPQEFYFYISRRDREAEKTRERHVENILSLESMRLEGGLEISRVHKASLPLWLQDRWEHLRLFRIVGERSGLLSHIALHSLINYTDQRDGKTRPSAAGGTRIYDGYRDGGGSIDDAIYRSVEDALLLSKAMTFKCGAADIRLGGSKCDVFHANNEGSPSKGAVLFDFARALEYLRVVFTGQDVGNSMADTYLMGWVGRDRNHTIIGPSKTFCMGGQPPTPPTALGTYLGIVECAKWVFHGKNDPNDKSFDNRADVLKGVRITIQGGGGVGSRMIPYLLKEGAILTVVEPHSGTFHKLKDWYGRESNITLVREKEAAYETGADIFAPCAMGGVLTEGTIQMLASQGVQLIAGCANNPLQNPGAGQILHQMGIQYAPDFVINQGGLVGVAADLFGYDPMAKVKGVPSLLAQIFHYSLAHGVAHSEAGITVVKNRIKDWEYVEDPNPDL